MSSGGENLVVERRFNDRKVVSLGFDSRSGNASLRPRERHFTLISHLAQAVYQLWWPSQTKVLQTEPKNCSALVCLDRRSLGLYEQTNE